MTAARPIRNAVWSVIGQGAGQGLSLVMFLALAHYVSKSDFGLVAVSLTIVEFVRRTVIDPATFALNARTNVTERDYDVCLSLLVIVSGVGALLLCLFAVSIATLVGTPETGPTLRVVALLLLAFGLSGTHGAWLARNMQFRTLALRAIISVLIGGAVGITMAVSGFGLWSLVGQQFTINAVNVVTLWWSVEWKPRFVLSQADVRDSVRRTRHIAASAIWNSVSNDSDLLFAAAYFGPAVAGVFNAAKRIMLAANMILVNAISSVALPALADLKEGDQRDGAFIGGLTIVSIATAPAFAGLAATAPEIVRVLLGPNWGEAAPILAALAASGYCLAVGQFATLILVIAERSHLDSLTSAATALIKVAVYAVAARQGPITLAMAVSLTTLATTPLRMRYALRALNVSWRDVGIALLPSLAGAGVMAVALSSIERVLPGSMPAIARLATLMSVGVVAYVAILRLVSPRLFRQAQAMLKGRTSRTA